jgi:hypothetical protein
MWGASPPAFLKAFPGHRGWSDLKNASNKSGPDIGLPVRISAEFRSGKPRNRPPSAGRRAGLRLARLESGRNPARKPDFRPGSTGASGPEIGLPDRMAAGLLPGKHRHRPEDRSRFFPGCGPAEIRPGRPIYGPEALLRNID